MIIYEGIFSSINLFPSVTQRKVEVLYHLYQGYRKCLDSAALGKVASQLVSNAWLLLVHGLLCVICW